MIQIRFPDAESKRQALGRLAGRFAFKSWATGEILVPEDALSFLVGQGVVFALTEPADEEQNGSAVQTTTNGVPPAADDGPDYYDTAAFRDALLAHFQSARATAIREQTCPVS